MPAKPKLVVIVQEGLVEEIRATTPKEAIEVEIVDLDGFDADGPEEGPDEAADPEQSKEVERRRCEQEYPYVLY